MPRAAPGRTPGHASEPASITLECGEVSRLWFFRKKKSERRYLAALQKGPANVPSFRLELYPAVCRAGARASAQRNVTGGLAPPGVAHPTRHDGRRGPAPP